MCYIFDMIDLHSHSAASDGVLSPADSARYAHEKKLSTWALTDHDTVDGLKEAAHVCAECGINFVPGIEINIAWPTGEFHLLGLGLRRYSDELKAVVEYLTEDRYKRNSEIVRKMNQDGYKYTLEEIQSSFTASQIGRPHFADFLVKKGIVRNRQEGFNRFLAKGKNWYVSHTGEDLETAVEAIKILLNLLINGTKTACIGEISNFVISCAFVLPASVIYYANKTRKNAFIGLICGVVINCIVGALLNAYLLIPLYAKVFYKTEDISGIIKAGTDKNSLIHDLRSFILFAVVPFNLIKTVLVTVVTGIIYKPVSHLLKKPV